MGKTGRTKLPKGYDYKYNLEQNGNWSVSLFDFSYWPKDFIARLELGPKPNVIEFEQACWELKKFLIELLDAEEQFWYTFGDN